jgi:hypothetical protein
LIWKSQREIDSKLRRDCQREREFDDGITERESEIRWNVDKKVLKNAVWDGGKSVGRNFDESELASGN